jgi:hypothetical protein
MRIVKTLAIASIAAAAAMAPVSATPGARHELAHGKLFKLQISCAAAQESRSIDDDGVDFANSGCAPAAAWVCTTPRADYLDKRPV